MKRYLVIVFVVIGLKANAQTPDSIQPPVDSITKLITYEGVIPAIGVKADALYKRALTWFRTYYNNPNEVIRENDSLKFRIVGKPRFRIQNLPDKSGMKSEAGIIQYTITLAAKDGRFKYELTEFNWKQASYYPSERWLDSKASSYQPAYPEYLRQLDETAKNVIRNLKDAMLNEKPVKDKDSW